MLTWNGSYNRSGVRESTDGYTKVWRDDTPHMTFKGYTQIANLEPETTEFLGRCEVYPVRAYDAPYKLFDPPLDRKNGSSQSQQVQNLQLFRKVDADLGTVTHLVRAARDLKKHIPLCFVGGQLMEEWKTEPHLLESGGYLMKAQELHDYFDFPRDGPNLVLQMNQYYNISKFIRDPFFREDGEGPNVAVDLILHPQAKVVVLVLYTLQDIKEGEEIFCARFVGNSKKSTHQNMVLAARVSHFYHRYAVKLEAAAYAAGLSQALEEVHQSAQDTAVRKKCKKVLTTMEQRLHMRGVDPKQKSVPQPPLITREEQEELRKQQLQSIALEKAPYNPNAPNAIPVEVAVARIPPAAPAASAHKRGAAAHALFIYFYRTLKETLKKEDFAHGNARRRHIMNMWNCMTSQEKEQWQMRLMKEQESAGSSSADPDGPAPMEEDAPATAAATATGNQDEKSEEVEEIPPPSSEQKQSREQDEEMPSAAAAVEDAENTGHKIMALGATSTSSNAAGAAAVSCSPSTRPSNPSPPSLASLTLATSSASPAAFLPTPQDLGYAPEEEGARRGGHIERDLMKLMDTAAAFKNTGCTHIPRSVFGRSMKQPTRIALLGVESPQFPDVIVIEGDRYPFNVEEAQKLLDSKEGYDPDKLEVREICSIASPCRYFCPPWYRSFCVVAKKALVKGELLCLYSGEMEQTIQHRCSSYVYHLPTSIGVSHFGKKYSAVPDLMIDAAAAGGIGRFINDNMFRNGEYQDESAANIGVQWIYQNMPHLVFYAKKAIGVGEELISSYGQEFWDVMCKQSLRGHSSYYHYIRPYTSSLEKLLSSRGVPVPPKPDVVIERETLFQPKVRPYDPPPEDSDEEDEGEQAVGKKKAGGKGAKKKSSQEEEEDDGYMSVESEEYIVERIVGKRFEPSGLVKYCVKWLGYEDASNTWEPLKNLDGSQELVSEFERRLLRRGMTVGQEPLPDPPADQMHDDSEPESERFTSPQLKPKVDAKPARKQPAFRNAIPVKKPARRNLTKEQLEAAPIDLTMEEEAPPAAAAAAAVAVSSSAPVAAPTSSLPVSSLDDLKSALTTTSGKGRKRLPTSIAVENDPSPPAKRRTRSKSGTVRVASPPRPEASTDDSGADSHASSPASAQSSANSSPHHPLKQVSLQTFFTRR